MSAKLRPYPVYKVSGVDWLGNVPDHWEIRTIKTLFREKDARSCEGKETLLSLTRDRGIVPHSEVSTRPVAALDLSKYKLCMPGDLVMNRMQAWSGVFAVSRYYGLVSPDYSVFTPATQSTTHVRFFELLFKTPMCVDQFAKRSKGIGSGFNRLYTPEFGSVHALSPPSAEQAAIVRFLDRADRRIRRYIRVKERLIELLEEQKQAIIHQAVTGQIDVRTGQPYPVYRDSGVEWLGMVPDHWQRVPNKAMLSRRKVLVGKKYTEFELLSLTKAGGIVRDVSSGRGKFSADMGTSQRVRCGDLVFCLFDVPETPRTVGLSEHDGMITGAYTVFECNDPVLGRFLEAFYIAMDNRKLLSPLYSGLRNTIPPSKFLQVKTPVPPRHEQRFILDRLAESEAKIGAAIKFAKKEVSLLNEYRTRMIADVVTGKLDVRAASVNLPEMGPVTGGTRVRTIQAESNMHAIEDGMAKEALS